MGRIDKLISQLRLPSPLDKIETTWSKSAGINLFIKRDDTIHPHICGNKWRKLKYGLIAALEAGEQGVITYGGAYSNHLVAVAAAAHFGEIASSGIVRSYEPELKNPSLHICRSYGMKLYFVHPKDYRLKSDSPQVQEILKNYSNYKEIPEGGTQESALKGVGEIVQEVDDQIREKLIDKIYTPIGTGGTMVGLVKQLNAKTQVIGVSPFKGEIKRVTGLDFLDATSSPNWNIVSDTLGIRFGAYSEDIVNYITQFFETQGIVLDPIYTARAMMKLEADCNAGELKEGSNIAMLHTGGLQGCQAYNHQYSNKSVLISESVLAAIN
ncbi:MAG: 1-aminocyclopropane-1-carboxylate deaminase [Saprospiraceae bacterium]|jgi:1-aminocyclopropane-1-carboxylate deaminase